MADIQRMGSEHRREAPAFSAVWLAVLLTLFGFWAAVIALLEAAMA